MNDANKETTAQKATRIFSDIVDNHACVRVMGCQDLCTPDYMQSQQDCWDDADECKDVDLTASKAWLWGDGVLIGIDTPEELEQYL